MKLLRTPDECFVDLPDFPYEPGELEVPAGDAPARLAYLDEGPADGEVVLCLHGEPSWSFLYRHMIPPLVDAGLRVVAPDLIGFGRSDKPADRTECTYARHVEWLRTALFDRLDLRDVTLMGQDWGGLLGLRLVGEHPERFARVMLSNTFLPTGDVDPGEAFATWKHFSQETPTLPIGAVIDGATTTDLSPEVVAGYDAPFPEERYKEAARQFPLLVPTRPDDPAAPANRAAWEVLGRFARPVRCAFGDADPVTRGADRLLIAGIPGAADQPHTTIEGGGHFIQEDRGPELAAQIVDLVHSTPGAAQRPLLLDV